MQVSTFLMIVHYKAIMVKYMEKYSAMLNVQEDYVGR
jgi:hypothetical protein